MSDSVPYKLSISRKVILGVVFTLVMLGMIALVSLISTRRFLATSAAVGEVREVLERSERAQRYFMEMESGVRGFMLSGDDDALIPYEHGQSFIIQELQGLRKLTAQNEEQQERLSRLQVLVGRGFAVHASGIERRREGGAVAAAQYFSNKENRREEDAIFTQIRDELNEIDQAERLHLDELIEQRESIGSVNTSLVLGGTVLTCIALIVAGIVVLRDIAQRKRGEENLEFERNLLRQIMDTIPDRIFVKDREGRFTRDNAAHRLHLGLEAEDGVVKKSDADFFSAELAKRYREDDIAVLGGTKTMVNVEEPGATPDGREIWLETTKVPLMGPDGKAIGIVGVSTDITKRKANEERLRHYAQQLQRSNEELQNFASVASHDLQEPLRKIQAFGDRLRARFSGQLGEQGSDFLARMMDAADRMQTLIQDLLKLSRVTTRALPFERCDLAETVRGVLGDLELKIASTSARVTAAGLPVIQADPTQMRQLFQNLVANALKFQPPGTRPEVLIAGRTFPNFNGELPEVPAGEPLCEIRVQDNGIGFSQEFAEQIFSPFKRLHARTEFEGSGIGLSVCRKITDRHRGKIVAHSTEGRGATFIVTLPLNQPQSP